MTIAQAFNEIAVAQGGTASKSGTIAGAIDALNDALAGSDQASAQTIEDAVRLVRRALSAWSSSCSRATSCRSGAAAVARMRISCTCTQKTTL